MRLATARSSWSPSAWPSRSLISAKRSMSRNITAHGTWGSRRAAARDVVEAVDEQDPVGKLGQRIVQGVVAQADLGGVAPGHV